MMDENTKKIIEAFLNAIRETFYEMYKKGYADATAIEYENGYAKGYEKGYNDGVDANSSEAVEDAYERGYMEAAEKIADWLEELRGESNE